MSRSQVWILVAALACFPLLFGLTPDPARAQTTTWAVGVGAWGDASSWSNGEPTAGVDAEMPIVGTAVVTLAGETCRNLTLGATGAGAAVRVDTGSLAVVQRLHLASKFTSSMTQNFGTVSAGELVIGSATAAASYLLFNGTLNLGSASIGTAETSSGSFTMSVYNPLCVIAGSLTIGKGGSFQVGAGTLNVGTTASDEVHVDGLFTLNNTPAVSMTRFTMTNTATLQVGVGALGVSTIMVAGPATLNGQLLILDIGAADGTYEVLRANPLQGTLTFPIPTPNWSYRIEGNSLLLVKGAVPVEPVTWSGLKTQFDR